MQHPIRHPETLSLRLPVLEGLSSMAGRWRVVNGGKELEVDTDLTGLSRSERAVVEFVLDPQITKENIFSLLDSANQKTLAHAIYKVFG